MCYFFFLYTFQNIMREIAFQLVFLPVLATTALL